MKPCVHVCVPEEMFPLHKRKKEIQFWCCQVPHQVSLEPDRLWVSSCGRPTVPRLLTMPRKCFICFLCSGAPTTKSQHCGRIRHEFGSQSLNSCRSWRTKSKYSSLTLVISYVRVLHIVFHLTLWPKKESLLQINELSNIWMIFSFWMLGDDVEYVDINRWFTLTGLWDFALLPEALHTEHGFLGRAEHGERFVVELTLKDSVFISNLPIIHWILYIF